MAPRFLAASAWIVGARVRVDGAPIRQHTLLVCNHTSWLDIVVLGGSTGCAFVSKDNLGLGFTHWLADQNDTVYVKRGHVKGAKDQATTIAKALERDKPVALFPEGTTGPGTHLLPFRSTLLEAANFTAKDVAIRPVAIDYGDAAAEVGWWRSRAKRMSCDCLAVAATYPLSSTYLSPSTVPQTESNSRAMHARKSRERSASSCPATRL